MMTEATFLWMLVAVASAVGNAVLLGIKIFGRGESRRIDGQPLRVMAEPEYLTRSAHAALCGPLANRMAAFEVDMQSVRHQMGADKREMIEKADGRVSKIFERIDGMSRTLAMVEERSETTQAEVRLIRQSMEQIMREMANRNGKAAPK